MVRKLYLEMVCESNRRKNMSTLWLQRQPNLIPVNGGVG